MVIKPRRTPVSFLQYEALLRRLPNNHEKYSKVKTDLKLYQSGLAGEGKIDYYLNLFQAAPYRILNQVRLQINGSSFEIDTLLVFRNMIVIVEVKNYTGKLKFDQSLSQVIQYSDENTRALPCPFFQTKRQAMLLQTWMQTNNFASMPICTHIAIANESAIILNTDPIEDLSKLSGLYDRLTQLYVDHTNQIISLKHMDTLAQALSQSSSEKHVDLLQQYKIDKSSLKKGVICTKCASFYVARKRARWACLDCKHEDPFMHLPTLRDYSLFFGNIITRQQANIWLNIQNKSTCLKLLRKISVPVNRSRKSANYQLRL